MKLLKPGLGDVIDRLSILAHKVVVGKETKHWRDEAQALIDYLNGTRARFTLWDLLLLAAVNAEIWEEMDLEEPHGALLKGLNLKRAELVARLNGEEVEKEKI